MAATNKVREELAQAFLEALNQGQIPWQACWAQGRPENAVTGKTYRGVNAIALSYAADHRGYTDPRWCTYRQAQEKGWQVRKGEKSARVEYWAYYDLKEKKLLSWQEMRAKLKADPDYEKNLQLRCRVYNVFNAQQIDGIPALAERPQTDIGTLREHRDTLIHNMGIGYEEYGNRAFYRPSTDTVTLPPEASFDDPYSYMATFLHECGHATGAAHRLNRDLSGFFGSESYAREELRAEIASAFTAQSLGLQLTPSQLEHHTQLHSAYVQHWAAILKDGPEELFRAIKAAEGISDYLIEKGEFDLKQKKTPQLFKAETIQQRKIMEWLVEQGITGEDVASTQLTGPAMVRITNPAGQYMDVYCGQDNTVRILDISEYREAELQQCFWEETNDPETQEWREDLAADEAAMVEQWDLQTSKAFSKLASAILERSTPAEQILEEIPDSPDLRLRFHGYGKIQDYSSVEARPWQSQIDRIREVVIEDGITGIGQNVLNDYPTLEKITWPGSIRQTHPYTLQNCPSLKEIAFSGGLQRIVEVQDLTSPYVLLNLANRYPDLTREQLSEVAEDLRDGASWEEISVYAKPDFSALQMNAIRSARDNGATPEQIDVIANPQFTPVQMDIIRNSFLRGMSMEEVLLFAKPELSAYEMLEPPVGNFSDLVKDRLEPEEAVASMTVVMVEPNKQARIMELPHTLEAMQQAVGGSIEATYPFEDPVAIICNEKGKLDGLPLNRGLYGEAGDLYDIVCGPFFVAGCGVGDFCSLSPELAQKYQEQFKSPEQFLQINGHIIGLKTDSEDIGQALDELMTMRNTSQAPEPTPAAEGPVLTMGG